MKIRHAVLLAVVLAVLLGIALREGSDPGAEQKSADGSGAEARNPKMPRDAPATEPSGSQQPAVHPGAERRPYDTGIKNDPRVRHTEDGKHHFLEAINIARQLHHAESSTEEDLNKLDSILGFYRTLFQQNPVAGDNQSVMAALMGGNSRDVVLFPPDHPSLNGDGELLDRWSSPYYFHALSGTLMEIISLGSDKKLGTDDDLIFTPRDERDFFRGTTDPPDYEEEE